MATAVLIMTIFWLAYSNGANDNFKGVATLYGSSTASFRRSLLWATIAMIAGSLVSVAVVDKLVDVFSGKGLVPETLVGTPQLLIAIGAGSAMTILLATWLGLPTSTTHALSGALVGTAVVASSSGINWGVLLYGIAGPLLLSPVIAIVMASTSYPLLRRVSLALGITRRSCVCLGTGAPASIRVQADGSAALSSSELCISVNRMENCVEQYQGQFLGVDVRTSINAIHYLSAGAVCFSRAVNDTPKIAALLLATGAANASWGLGLVAIAMAAGGLLNSRRVAETMSKRITNLSPGQGLSANMITAILVFFASQFGLPVSTTHVSC